MVIYSERNFPSSPVMAQMTLKLIFLDRCISEWNPRSTFGGQP